jgi:hypothetical protein
MSNLIVRQIDQSLRIGLYGNRIPRLRGGLRRTSRIGAPHGLIMTPSSAKAVSLMLQQIVEQFEKMAGSTTDPRS